MGLTQSALVTFGLLLWSDSSGTDRIHYCCSVWTGKSKPEGSPFQLGLPRFLLNGELQGWDVPVYTEQQ